MNKISNVASWFSLQKEPLLPFVFLFAPASLSCRVWSSQLHEIASVPLFKNHSALIVSPKLNFSERCKWCWLQMALSWAERCSVSSRWWSAGLMDALSKALDKKPAAPHSCEKLKLKTRTCSFQTPRQNTHKTLLHKDTEKMISVDDQKIDLPQDW